jgi:hypothetical protein
LPNFEAIQKNRVVNLRALSKNSKQKVNDYETHPPKNE